MRRAFIMGSNGPSNLDPLRFARFDAQNFAMLLGAPKCGFEIRVPEPGLSAFAVRQQLYKEVEACGKEDTFLCYFSGHGFLERGSLFLLWDDSDLNRLLTSTLPVTELLQALRLCRADNKLLVLDCCHAGAVVNMAGLKSGVGVSIQETEIQPENHLVLMASNRLERARELESIGGSFMTRSICEALQDRFEEADQDGDNRLSIEDLKRWLELRASQHNSTNAGCSVPVPFLFGQKKGEFYLTKGSSDWEPYEVPWPDGSIMVVLPIRSASGILCMSKCPVTNAQYRRFVETTSDGGIVEPEGKRFNRPTGAEKGEWVGPFFPWRDVAFANPNQPVVCVSYEDALAYCDWINTELRTKRHSLTSLPTVDIWDFAAFGNEFPSRNPALWLSRSKSVHHRASATVAMDITGERTNQWGLADMVGNVWEWCRGRILFIGKEKNYENDEDWQTAVRQKLKYKPEIRGGGFMDDLARTEIFLDASQLPRNIDTRHFDLGFRIAAQLDQGDVPAHILQMLHTFKEHKPLYFVEPVAA